MSSVLIFDTWGAVSPSFVATQQVGGSHMHLAQIAEYLAGQGMRVDAYHMGPRSDEGGVRYWSEHTLTPQTVDTLILVGNSTLPATCWKRAFAFQVIDPRPVPHLFDHLKGVDITMVCVSDWQAGLFRNLGFKTHVIPVPIPDEWYGPSDIPRTWDFGCFSSWNKGAKETVEAWDSSWGRLAVGSPYSQPADASLVCAHKDVMWLGSLQPREKWIQAMRSVGAIARICTIGETFGVVDVAARAMGKSCYTLCTGDIGALREVGAEPFTDPAEWREAIKQRRPHPGGDAEQFRLSRVLPQWLELIK